VQIYTWDPTDFPIPFPDTLPRTGPAVKLGNLLSDPDYNLEIEELAVDKTTGSLRKLDFMQVSIYKVSTRCAMDFCVIFFSPIPDASHNTLRRHAQNPLKPVKKFGLKIKPP
jgi:hypothetical protein